MKLQIINKLSFKILVEVFSTTLLLRKLVKRFVHTDGDVSAVMLINPLLALTLLSWTGREMLFGDKTKKCFKKPVWRWFGWSALCLHFQDGYMVLSLTLFRRTWKEYGDFTLGNRGTVRFHGLGRQFFPLWLSGVISDLFFPGRNGEGKMSRKSRGSDQIIMQKFSATNDSW